jgi:thioredoxin
MGKSADNSPTGCHTACHGEYRIMSNSVITVNQSDFATSVLEQSHTIAVLVDFWAPWCGPCRMLGPVLEKLAREPDSGFVLAKVNSDHNQELAQQYNVRGIPAVKLFVNGKMVDQFVGAKPEGQVRHFMQGALAKHRPKRAHTRSGSATPSAPPTQGDPRALLLQGDGCAALAALTDRKSALRPLARFLCDVSEGKQGQGSTELDTQYRQAADALRRREPAAALYALLVARSQAGKGGEKEIGRIADGILQLYQESHPALFTYRALFGL